MIIEYRRFIEWLRNKPGEFSFMLNNECVGCGKVSKVVLKHRVYFYCGGCWNEYVGFVESIER